MVLHCRDESQHEVHHHDGSQGGVERCKAEVHTERGGWGMFEGVKRRDASPRCRAINYKQMRGTRDEKRADRWTSWKPERGPKWPCRVAVVKWEFDTPKS